MAPLKPADAERFLLVLSPSAAADSPAPRPGTAERLLLDAAHRALRAPQTRLAIVLHLGKFPPPGPEPHHRRIARALMTEAAQRHEGQLFPLGNGDLVLLCRATAAPTGTSDDPDALPGTLARLFAGEAPEPEALVSLWPLAEQADRLLAYAGERSAAEMPGPAGGSRAAEQPATPPLAARKLRHLVPPPAPAPTLSASPPALPELIERRTAASVIPASGAGRHAIQPIFRDLSFSEAALEAHYAPPHAGPADPWLCRHLVQRFDEQLLTLIEAALPGDGPLGMAGIPRSLALHLGLSPQTIMKPRFQHFAHLCRSIGVKVGIEISLVAAMAVPTLFAAARALLRRAGFRLILGGISPPGLRLIRAEALEPDLLKLDWTARLARLAEPDQGALAAAIAAIGPERVVLQRADTEQALLWGLDQGIHRFLGRHVDAMLAARRMLVCPVASACTLHQCTERAATATAPGRRFCRNPSLLDAGAPAVTPPR